MKTLLILRHAKSSWKHPELSDHDRPLNKRGKHDAPLMGRLLKEKELVPDLIISSTAVRAKDTALVVGEVVGYTKKISFLSSLYSASPDAYIQAINDIAGDNNYSTILVVGHNPGLEELIEGTYWKPSTTINMCLSYYRDTYRKMVIYKRETR